jgi:putative MATE family efflux protein
MLGVGATTLVSHAAGRKERDRAVMLFNQAQVLSMAAGGAFLVVAMVGRLPYSNTIAADRETAALAADYLLWFIPAMAGQFAMVAMAASLRGIGDFKPGMIVQTTTVVINMILAPILIFGWGTGYPLGVAGAAMSSLVAVGIGVVWLSTYFLSADQFLHFRRADWRPRLRVWADMLKIGLPAGAEFGLTAVYLVVVYSVMRPFGASAQASFGIGLRLVQALFLPVVALGFSVGPVAGQNVGARKPDRVRSAFMSGVGMAVAFMLVSTLICYLWTEELFAVFSKDPEVIRVGVEYLRIVSLSFFASGIVFVSSSMFQALGNTIPPLLTSLGRVLLVSIPIVIFSGEAGFRLTTIWYLSVGATLVQMIANLLLLRREFRLRLSAPRLDQPSLSA